MKTSFKLLPVLLIFYSVSAQCQKQITARVVDETTNKPVDKAIVYIEGDSLRTMTNHLGYFQLIVDSLDILIVEKEGYMTSSIQVPPQNSFLIRISPDELSNAIEVSNDYEKGKSLDGYKKGVWEYSDEPGEVVLRVDYENGQILYLKQDTSKYAIQFGKEYKMSRVAQQPRYVGSMKEFDGILGSNVLYPKKARNNKTVGTFHIIFEVDSTGQAVNFRAVNDIGDGCGDAVLEVLRTVPNIWIPAMIDGKPRNARLSIPVTFKITVDGQPKGRKKKKAQNEEVPMSTYLTEIEIAAVGLTRTQ